MYKDKYIILEKIEGVYRPDQLIGNKDIRGYCRHGIEIGKQLYLYDHPIKGVRPYAWTSTVIEVKDDIIITKNSAYKIIINE
jgi:hypothetical protein